MRIEFSPVILALSLLFLVGCKSATPEVSADAVVVNKLEMKDSGMHIMGSGLDWFETVKLESESGDLVSAQVLSKTESQIVVSTTTSQSLNTSVKWRAVLDAGLRIGILNTEFGHTIV